MLIVPTMVPTNDAIRFCLFMMIPFGLVDKVNGKPQHNGVQCKEYGYIKFVHG
jgi:hypothetical protein